MVQLTLNYSTFDAIRAGIRTIQLPSTPHWRRQVDRMKDSGLRLTRGDTSSDNIVSIKCAHDDGEFINLNLD